MELQVELPGHVLPPSSHHALQAQQAGRGRRRELSTAAEGGSVKLACTLLWGRGLAPELIFFFCASKTKQPPKSQKTAQTAPTVKLRLRPLTLLPVYSPPTPPVPH